MLYLTFKADLSPTIKSVSLNDPRNQDFSISSIRCLSCHDSDSSKTHKVALLDTEEDENGHEFNFIMKCKFCRNKMTLNLNVINEPLINYKYEHGNEDSDFVTEMKTSKNNARKKQKLDKVVPLGGQEDVAILLELDCRGCVVEELTYDQDSNGLDVHVAGDAVLEDLFLEDMELYDFDEVNDTELSITEVSWGIVKK